MRNSGLWLRWSLRDLRHRWPVVVALALVIAIGTGAAAALGSMAQWRRLSNDASYAAFGMHDLAVTFGEARPDAARALAAVRGIPHARWIRAVEPRLDVATQVEITAAGGRAVVLPGRLVGLDSTAGGPTVDRVLIDAGSGEAGGGAPAAGSPVAGSPAAGSPVTGSPVAGSPAAGGGAAGVRQDAVLEKSFAEHYGLPDTGTVRVAGGHDIAYAGRGQSPEYLMNGSAGWLGQTMRAVLYLPLDTARRLAGAPGALTSLVLALTPDADAAVVRAELAAALAAALPAAPAVVADRSADPGYRILYDDIDTDQRFWNLVAMLMLGGGALATLNLANRVVSAQRRELGVGMALGVPARTLAVRPLLFGAQVVLLGALAGLAVGAVLGWAIIGLLDTMLPLPVWRTPFQAGEFLRAAAWGTLVPLLGIAYPVIRVTRTQPADAIRTAHVGGGRSGRIGAWLARLPLPGRTTRLMAVRHVLRAPGRTALTAAGVGAAICVLVGMLGMLDAFGEALDRSERELTRQTPDRAVVGLDGFHPVGDQRLADIAALPQVERAEPGLRLAGTARARSGPAEGIDLMIDVLDFRTAMWTPTLDDPTLDDPVPGGRDGAVVDGSVVDGAVVDGVPGGIVLAEKAAADLGVRPGDTITLEHPRSAGDGRFTTVTTVFTVSATHPQPSRPVAYLDGTRADVFGLAGTANLVTVRPAAGVDEDALRAVLLDNRMVTDVLSVTALGRASRDLVGQFTDVLTLLELFVLVLALLIAFNAASVNTDERRRQHATMLAFGLRPRVVLGITMAESLLVGLFGTALGTAAGAVATYWTVGDLAENTMPEWGLRPGLTGGTLLIALAVGVVAVTLAPALTLRRVRRMAVPEALRLVE